MFLTQWHVSSSSSSVCALCWGIASNYLSLSLSLSLSIYIYIYIFILCKLWGWQVMVLDVFNPMTCQFIIIIINLCIMLWNSNQFYFLWHLSFCTHCDTIKFTLYINYMLLCLMSSYHTIWLFSFLSFRSFIFF